MYRIFGLGNKGEEYQGTPHNIGVEILEIYQKNNSDIFSSSYFDKKRDSRVYQNKINEDDIELIFFENFMNNSGKVFNGVFSKGDELGKEKIIIIHDDINLPFGEFRISFNRGDGGHNGIKDIVKKINSKKFIRIRIGVCPVDSDGECRKPESGKPLNNYLVYKKLSKKNLEKYSDFTERFEYILKEILKNGYKSAMNKFN